MQQLPYSIMRMLCHILIGFVGGTLFLASGKVLPVDPLQDWLADIGPMNGRGFVLQIPGPEGVDRPDFEAAKGTP